MAEKRDEAVVYALEPDLPVEEFVAVLEASGLAARRPVDDLDRLERMLDESDLIVTARLVKDGYLVGVARSVTDFAYCCYLSDLAVDRGWQGQGIGKTLLAWTKEAAGGDQVNVYLVSAPDAVSWYEARGLERLDTAFRIPRRF